MAKKKAPVQRLAGNNHEARFARVTQAAGGDPASLLMMLALMERIVAEDSSTVIQEIDSAVLSTA